MGTKLTPTPRPHLGRETGIKCQIRSTSATALTAPRPRTSATQFAQEKLKAEKASKKRLARERAARVAPSREQDPDVVRLRRSGRPPAARSPTRRVTANGSLNRAASCQGVHIGRSFAKSTAQQGITSNSRTSRIGSQRRGAKTPSLSDAPPAVDEGLKTDALPGGAAVVVVRHRSGLPRTSSRTASVRGAAPIAAQDHQNPRQLPQRRCGAEAALSGDQECRDALAAQHRVDRRDEPIRDPVRRALSGNHAMTITAIAARP